MNPFLRKILLGAALGIILGYVVGFLTGCGGSSGTSSSSGNSSSGIENIGDIPLDVIDPAQYDVSLTSASASLNAKAMPGEIGGFSRAGCEASQARNRIIREAKFPKMILCHMTKMAEGLGMELGDGDYNYYNLGEVPGGPDEMGGSMDMKIAVKKVEETITMLMCENDVKVMEFVITADIANNIYEGHVVDRWVFEDGLLGEITESRRLDFSTDGDSDTFTNAEFSQVFSSDRWGYGAESLIATPEYSVVNGYHQDSYMGNNFTGSAYARFSASEGTTKYYASGTYPPTQVAEAAGIDQGWYEYLTDGEWGLGLADDDFVCCDSEGCFQVDSSSSCEFTDEGTESFEISGAAPNQIFTVTDTSDFEDLVSDVVLQDPASRPAIEFALSPKDASASSIGTGGTLVSLNEIAFSIAEFSDCGENISWEPISGQGIDADISECLAIEEEINDFQNHDHCHELEEQARQVEAHNEI